MIMKKFLLGYYYLYHLVPQHHKSRANQTWRDLIVACHTAQTDLLQVQCIIYISHFNRLVYIAQ